MNGHKRNVHFVGVGGIGMSGLAEILLNLDYTVSGSDMSASDITRRLQSRGLRFEEGHAAENVGDAGILVVSAAVPESNPEVMLAREKAIPVLHRSELLAHIMRLKPNAVAVGGTHGKTTTTSMISAIMDHANIGATTIVGGILHRSGTNARWGTGDYIVAEADEHDGSFLHLHPTIAVVTNVDAEHLEYYGTIDNIKRAFTEFCNGVPFYGFSIVCAEDENCRSIMPDIHSVCISYGIDRDASVVGSNIRLEGVNPALPLAAQLDDIYTLVDIEVRDPRLSVQGHLGTIGVQTLGRHNVLNALAGVSVGLCLGLPFTQIAEGLETFTGVRRRLHVRGVARGVTVVEDYAHHPTEIRSTLEALRLAEPRRVLAVFQPHLYSRTKYFYKEFAEVLSHADAAFVTDIYASREEPMLDVDAGMIVDAARDLGRGSVELIRDMKEVPLALKNFVEEGDAIVVLGAGDINRICDPMLKQLAAGSERLV